MSAAKAQPILSPDAWRGLSALRVQPRGPRCGWGVSDGGCCGAIVWGIVCQGHTVFDVCQGIRAALGTRSASGALRGIRN